MIKERRNKFIAFVIGMVATMGILFATVDRHSHRHCEHGWHQHSQQDAEVVE